MEFQLSKLVLAVLFNLVFGTKLFGSPVEYSLLVRSMAPNAGGQEAYSLRAGDAYREVSIFVNQYLLSGPYPLIGATYAYRLEVCSEKCWWWRIHVQVGAGVSSAGPLIELTWSMIPLSILRIDVTTQAFLTRDRLIVWGYPLWLGVTLPVSLPFFW